MNITINPKTDALLVIDIQNDFCPGGALAVAGGDEIVPGVIALAKRFENVILSQDWHPAYHSSFASTHRKPPFSSIQLPYGEQTLWPDHCVQDTAGAEFTPALVESGLVTAASTVVRKGSNPDIDSYSAFFENDRKTQTGLVDYFREQGIERVFMVGLAYDFCVGYSAIDAKAMGFDAVVVKDLTRAIGMPMKQGTTVDAIEQGFQAAGVEIANSTDFADPPIRTRSVAPQH